MAELFWLSDEQWQAIAPFMPKNQPGARRKDDRTILSGILHVIESDCRWKDGPSDYEPSTTVYHYLGTLRSEGKRKRCWQQGHWTGGSRSSNNRAMIVWRTAGRLGEGSGPGSRPPIFPPPRQVCPGEATMLQVGLPRFCGRLRGLAEQDLGCGFWAVLLFVDEG